MKIKTKNAKETKSLAQKLAKDFVEKRGPLILALSGDLGTGKTTFTQSFAKALGVKKRILSPTFLIMKRFPLKMSNFQNLYHLDAYRIKAPDLKKLNVEDVFKGQNIVLIEWAEKARDLLPPETIWIYFKSLDENTREITTLNLV